MTKTNEDASCAFLGNDSQNQKVSSCILTYAKLRRRVEIKIWMIRRLPVAQARLTFGTTFMLSQQPLAACSASYRPYTCLKMHHVKTMPSVSVGRPLTVRCMASSRNSEEKSWSELASKLPIGTTAHELQESIG